MKHVFFLMFLSLCIMMKNIHAQTQTQASTQTMVYLCVDEHGRKTYQNTGIENKKGCKRVDLPSITTVPAPFKSNKQTATANSFGSSNFLTSSTSTSSNFNSHSAKSLNSARPYDFPRVDSGTQKARDNDRYQILSDELKTEEAKLASLKQEFNNGEPERKGDERNYAKYQERVSQMRDNIARTTRNIEALKREIGNLK